MNDVASDKTEYVRQRMGSMSLHKRVSLILVAMMAVFILASDAILTRVISPIFDQLEDANARKNLVRVHQAIAADLTNIVASTGDWAGWDESYQFVKDENEEFIADNLNQTSLSILGVNLILYFDDYDRLVWSSMVATGMGSDPLVAATIARSIRQRYSLTQHPNLESAMVGFVQTRFGPMLISSMPILTSDLQGPIAGTLMMARFMDDHLVSKLRDRTEVEFNWYQAEHASPEVSAVVESLSPGQEMSYMARSDSHVMSYGLLRDMNGDPLLILRTSTPMEITILGTQTIYGALFFLAIAGALMTLAIWFLLRRSIVMPLTDLAQHIVGMRTSGDLTRRIGMARYDEIGVLASEFDGLTAELYIARQDLQDQSYKAGKAELAAEVLHNIRNAMTPLVNSIERVTQSARRADELNIDKAAEELMSDSCPVERKQKMVRYLELAIEEFARIHGDASGDLKIAATQAMQIQLILTDQEKLAHVKPVMEALDLNDVVSESILVIPKSDSTDIEVELDGDLNGHKVKAHRVSLLQVISNMLVNASESIQKTSRSAGKIALTAEQEHIDQKPMIRLTVRDDGAGIDQDKLKKIFRRGFTTKDSGSGGLGLHWCANAVASMGGRIRAESEGKGQGAAFHVLLPAAQEGQQS